MGFESPFHDVVRTVDADACMRCRERFARGDSVVQYWIVAGVGGHPRTGARVPFLNDAPGFGHARCRDRMLDIPTLIEIPRQKLVTATNDQLRPRTPEFQCHVCKVVLRRGDVVLTAARVLGVGIDPDTKFPGVECSDEFECCHVDCRDPQLSLGGPIVLGGGAA